MIVIPLGVVMFIKEFVWLDRAAPIAVTSTVGSIIGMIPEGLYLLTSLALVAGVVRLAQRKTLVHELGCIETLARVDTLCVDKTGTVTENKMIVEDVCPLCDDRFTLDDIRMIMADYVYAMQADNDTMAALRRYFTGEKDAGRDGDAAVLVGEEIRRRVVPRRGDVSARCAGRAARRTGKPLSGANRGLLRQGLPRAAAGHV